MSVKIGIIGCGGIAHSHANAYKKLGDRIEFVACCDLDEKKAKDYADEFGFQKYYSDCYTMLRENKLDAVSVCTWNSAHAECTIAALNADCHVFCEKPMAMNANEAIEMKNAAEKNHKLLMVGFVRRHGNDAKMAKKLVESGELGDVYYAKAAYLRRCGCPGGWFGDKSRSGGGPLVDLGVHIIDLSRYIMGNHKITSVFGATFDKLGARNDIVLSADDWKSSTTTEKDIFDVEDLATAMIRFDNGAVLQVETSFNLNIRENLNDISFFGSKAGYNLNSGELYTIINYQPADIKLKGENTFNFGREFGREAKNFIDSIEGKAELVATGDDGIELMRVLDAIYESAKTEKSVDIIR